jgi:Rrf2 family protein
MPDAPSFIEPLLHAGIQRVRPAGETGKAAHDSLAVPKRKPLLPDKAILAIAVVAEVAIHCRHGLVTGEMLAKRRGLSPRYLEPMLQTLVQEGILKGVRGRRGGYTLGRERDRISAADILHAAVAEIRRDAPACSNGPDRTVANALAQVEEAFSEALARVTLADLTGAELGVGLD